MYNVCIEGRFIPSLPIQTMVSDMSGIQDFFQNLWATGSTNVNSQMGNAKPWMNPDMQSDPAADPKRKIMMQLLTRGQQQPEPAAPAQPQALDQQETTVQPGQISQPEQSGHPQRQFGMGGNGGAMGRKPPRQQRMRPPEGMM